MQCIWSVLLTLSGQYNDLLDYVIFAVLLFYILTIGGCFACATPVRIWSGRTEPWATPSCQPSTSLSPA